jgi:hypothetical protein
MQNDNNPQIFNSNQNMFSGSSSSFNAFSSQNNNTSSASMFSLLGNSQNPQQKQTQNPYLSILFHNFRYF